MIRGSGGSSNEKMHSDYLRVDKISLLSKDLFHGYNTDTHAVSFVTVYINVRQDRLVLIMRILAKTTILTSFCV